MAHFPEIPEKFASRIRFEAIGPTVPPAAPPPIFDDYVPPGETVKPPVSLTAAQRNKLLLSQWLQREIPPRDYLLGNVFSTSSRVLIYGETGVGKTLFAVDLAGAIASGEGFMNWEGRRRSRVMYLDGELPPDTFKERMQLVASRYNEGIELYGYNRFDLEEMGVDMPPLNTEPGEAWLMAEIEALKPDAIVFDSIMCLTVGSMSDEEGWAPIKALVRKLSARRIAQFWLHHTGHDATKGFGTKTREWEMDTVVSLTRADKDDTDSAIKLEFKKARLKTPTTAAEFEPKQIKRSESDWTCEAATGGATGKGEQNQVSIVKTQFVRAYDFLADGVADQRGFNGGMVKKVKVDAVRDALRRRGFLEAKDTGGLTTTARSHFNRAKSMLLTKGGFVEDNGLIWKTTP
jgi:hypothetical protein